MTPTSEQLTILQAGRERRESLMINAMAGCAKTTTLQLLAKAMPLKPSLALAFNVRIKEELQERFPKHFEVLTLNGLGHRAWNKAIGRRCRVDTNKMYGLQKAYFDKYVDKQNPQVEWSDVSTLVRLAKSNGLIPDPISKQFRGRIDDTFDGWESLADGGYIDLTDDNLDAARVILSQSITLAFDGVLDYDDQIYMSACFGGRFDKYPVVMVDEAQDLSPLNHLQISKTIADRLIVCGDPRQAIYAFRGADSSSMEKLRGLRDTWLDLPLTTTFRCPKTVVARQQAHAPGFTAAESAPEGEISQLSDDQPWTIRDVMERSDNRNIAILCRNNAPIIACALRIIRGGVGCTVLGNDVGRGLISLTKKIIPDDDTQLSDCVDKIEKWRAAEVQTAIDNRKDERVGIINDKADSLLAVCENGDIRNAADIRRVLLRMFDKNSAGRITLSTGHKSKGLEWPVVLHLDPWRVPSMFALRAAEEGHTIPLEQDRNLQYVIETRTKDKLIFANLKQMER